MGRIMPHFIKTKRQAMKFSKYLGYFFIFIGLCAAVATAWVSAKNINAIILNNLGTPFFLKYNRQNANELLKTSI